MQMLKIGHDIEYSLKDNNDGNPAGAMLALLQGYRFDRSQGPDANESLPQYKKRVEAHADRFYETLKNKGVNVEVLLTTPQKVLDCLPERFAGAPADIAVGMGRILEQLGLSPQYLKLTGQSKIPEQEKPQIDSCYGLRVKFPESGFWVLVPGFSAPLALPVNNRLHKIVGLSAKLEPLFEHEVDPLLQAKKRATFRHKYLEMITHTRVSACIDSKTGPITIKNEEIPGIVHRTLETSPMSPEDMMETRMAFKLMQQDSQTTYRAFQVNVSTNKNTFIQMSEAA